MTIHSITADIPRIAGVTLALLLATAPVIAQDRSLNPTFGIIDLEAGFPTDPNWVYLLAGGATEMEYLDASSGESCAGYFADAPDFRLVFAAGSGLPLSITAESEDDTVLLVSGPDNAWYCNDDTYGLNPAVTFETPRSGVYNIWVGTYSQTDDEFPPTKLGFTEFSPFEAQILRSFFGQDDRLVLDPTIAPWSMIGLVELTEGICTGTLIGPSTVLTGGHCIANDGEDDTPPIAFLAGYQNGQEIARAGVTGYHVPAGWRAGEQEGMDFAFFFLDRPLGDTLGWMDVGPLTAAELAAYAAGHGPDILQAGYSADQSEVLTGNLDCPFVELGPENTLVHQCDTVQGDSGSPLFVQDGNRYRIIGVESYTDERPELEFDINIAMYVEGVLVELQTLSSGTRPQPAAPYTK